MALSWPCHQPCQGIISTAPHNWGDHIASSVLEHTSRGKPAHAVWAADGGQRASAPPPTRQKVAGMLRAHEHLILNWFRAKGEISAGAVEGLNNKIRVVTRRSYGLRTYKAMEIALYHNLGRLPEPEITHRFCPQRQKSVGLL